MKNKTLVVIKPDGIKKSLTGNILTRLSETKLRIIGAKVMVVTRKLAEEHYSHLIDKPFFEDVYRYMSGEIYEEKYRRVLALVYSGDDAVLKVRQLAGATNPEEADSATIRGQYGRITSQGVFENVLHCSATPEEAEKEIKLWFEPDEMVEDIYPTVTRTVTMQKREWK